MQTWKNWLNPWEIEFGPPTLSLGRMESSLNVSYRTLDTICQVYKQHFSWKKKRQVNMSGSYFFPFICLGCSTQSPVLRMSDLKADTQTEAGYCFLESTSFTEAGRQMHWIFSSH